MDQETLQKQLKRLKTKSKVLQDKNLASAVAIKIIIDQKSEAIDKLDKIKTLRKEIARQIRYKDNLSDQKDMLLRDVIDAFYGSGIHCNKTSQRLIKEKQENKQNKQFCEDCQCVGNKP